MNRQVDPEDSRTGKRRGSSSRDPAPQAAAVVRSHHALDAGGDGKTKLRRLILALVALNAAAFIVTANLGRHWFTFERFDLEYTFVGLWSVEVQSPLFCGVRSYLSLDGLTDDARRFARTAVPFFIANWAAALLLTASAVVELLGACGSSRALAPTWWLTSAAAVLGAVCFIVFLFGGIVENSTFAFHRLGTSVWHFLLGETLAVAAAVLARAARGRGPILTAPCA